MEGLRNMNAMTTRKLLVLACPAIIFLGSCAQDARLLNTPRRTEQTQAFLKHQPLDLTIITNRYEIAYPKNLQPQAQQLTRQLDRVFTALDNSLHLPWLPKPKFYLVHSKEIPNWNTAVPLFQESSPGMSQILFVRSGADPLDRIIADNPMYPMTLFHEITEIAICLPEGFDVRDPEQRSFNLTLSLPGTKKTRWFREGLATYAALRAFRAIESDLGTYPTNIDGLPFPLGYPMAPFSCLERHQNNLFTWSQTDQSEDIIEEYEAALGLFLLLEYRHGQAAIPTLVKAVADAKPKNGAQLIKVCNASLKTDIEKLATNFRLPRLGFQVSPLPRPNQKFPGVPVISLEPNSAADRAGVRIDDAVTRIGDRTIIGSFDLQMALLQLGETKASSTHLTVWRKDRGSQTIELPLTH